MMVRIKMGENIMQQLNDTTEKMRYIEDSIQELQDVSNKAEELETRKKILMENIAGALGHEYPGSRTYRHGNWKVLVKSPKVLYLNRDVYKKIRHELPDNFNPVKESVSYSLSKELYDAYVECAPEEIKQKITQMVDVVVSKPTVFLKRCIGWLE